MADDLTGVTYLQVRRAAHRWGHVRVVKATQGRPDQLEPGCVLVKVSLSVPAEVFRPHETSIVVPVHQAAVAGTAKQVATESTQDGA